MLYCCWKESDQRHTNGSYKLTQANPGPNPNASEIVTAIHL